MKIVLSQTAFNLHIKIYFDVNLINFSAQTIQTCPLIFFN